MILKTTYIEQNSKSILHKIDNPRLPFNWGANPYRGCLHSCIYCYARYTHRYLDLDPESDFETTIIIKKNAAQILRKELSNPKWIKELVNLGSICDPYQPIERKYQITREMLKEFSRYKVPFTIATKSNLISRDIDIIAEMSKDTYVDVVISISSINDQIRKQIEPRATSTQGRLKLAEELSSFGINVGILLMPIIPFLNDSDEDLEELFSEISKVKPKYVIPGIMYLTSSPKKRFLEFIEMVYPKLLSNFKDYYKGRSPPKSYKESLYKKLMKLRQKYNLHEYKSSYTNTSSNNQSKLDSWF